MMTDDYELRFLNGTLHAMRGETREAMQCFEACHRLAPDAADPLIQLLDCCLGDVDRDRQDRLAGLLLAGWPNHPDALRTISRMHEMRGEPKAALRLLESGSIELGPQSNAYPDYLRLLLGAGRWADAAREAGRTNRSHSMWAPQAHLTLVLAHLHLGHEQQALAALEGFDVEEFAVLVDFWFERLGRATVRAATAALLREAVAAHPDNSRVKRLADRA